VRLRVAALWMLALIALTACSKGSSPRSAGTLVIAVTAEPQSLNPLLLEGPTDVMVGSFIYSYLVTDGPNGEFIPDVAMVVPSLANGGIARDGLHITYHLRHNVRWQDGVKLTAHDCVFTYRAIVNPKTSVPTRYGYDDIVLVTAPDDYTLKLTLKRPLRSIVSGFLASDGNYAIMPEHLLARYSSLDRIDFNAHPIGSGPYRVAEWVRGDHLSLDANPAYFRGAPAIKHVRIEFISDSTTMLNELRTGEIDAAFYVDPALYQEARTIPGMRVVLTPISGMGAIVMNTEKGPTSDLRVRAAIASAINSALIVQRASHGAYLAENGRAASLHVASYLDQAPSYDPARARELFEAAGWRTGADGIRRKNGQRLTLTLTTSPEQPMSSAVTALIQAELRNVGIDVAIHSYASALYKAPAAAGGPIFAGKFSLAYILITVGGDGDLAFLYLCPERPPIGFDISRLCDSRVDAAAIAGERSYDPMAVKRDNTRLEQLLEADIPEVILYQPQRVQIFTTRLQGFEPTRVTPYTNAWRWRLR
jgi:peptide/nickel transport system substrate-binding protein